MLIEVQMIGIITFALIALCCTHASVLPYNVNPYYHSLEAVFPSHRLPVRAQHDFLSPVQDTRDSSPPMANTAREKNVPYYVLISADDYTDVYMDGELVGQTRWWTSTLGLKVWKYPGTVISIAARDVRLFAGIGVAVYKGRTLVAETGSSDVFYVAPPRSIKEGDLSWTKPGYNYCNWEIPTVHHMEYKKTPFHYLASPKYVWSSDAKSPVAYLTFTVENITTENGSPKMESMCK